MAKEQLLQLDAIPIVFQEILLPGPIQNGVCKKGVVLEESIAHPKHYHTVQTIISTKISLIDTKIHACKQ